MRLTRRQRKERKACGLSVEPTVLESSRSLFDTLDRIMPREILAPLNEADAWRLREMSVAGTPAEIAAGAERAAPVVTIIERVQIATGIPDWEPLSATEPSTLFCVWSDRRWRVERVGARWEVEIRSGPASRLCAGPDLEQTIADAMMVDGVNQRR